MISSKEQTSAENERRIEDTNGLHAKTFLAMRLGASIWVGKITLKLISNIFTKE